MRPSIEVKFKLKIPANADGTQLIQALSYFGSDRLKLSTGINISPSHWSKENGLLNEAFGGSKDGKLITRQLGRIESNIKHAYQLVIDSGGKGTIKKVRQRYEELAGKRKIGGLSFFECVERHIERAMNGEIKTGDGKPFSDGRIKIYQRNKKYLGEYAKRKLGKSDLNFEDVLSEEFYNKFKRFLETTEFVYKTKNGARRTAGKLTANSVGQHIQVLKTFLNAAETYEGIKFDFNYSKAFKVTDTPQKKVYLNLNELDAIEKLDLSDEPTLNQIRDWLLITCFTGLRVSDFKRLKPAHFDLENSTLAIYAQKTGKPSYVPLFPAVKRIIERYKKQGGFFPTPYAEPILNRKFKDVALMAGIDNKVMVVEYVGNKMIEVTVPKYEKVSTKTGRTSFISNMLSLGFSKEQIKKITGHKTDRAFEGYDQLEGETNAKAVLVEFKKRTGKLTAV